MMALIGIIAVLLTALAAVKAVAAVKLLENDPAAWERLCEAEEKKRRQRQEFIGKSALNVMRALAWLLKREKGDVNS